MVIYGVYFYKKNVKWHRNKISKSPPPPKGKSINKLCVLRVHNIADLGSEVQILCWY